MLLSDVINSCWSEFVSSGLTANQITVHLQRDRGTLQMIPTMHHFSPEDDRGMSDSSLVVLGSRILLFITSLLFISLFKAFYVTFFDNNYFS